MNALRKVGLLPLLFLIGCAVPKRPLDAPLSQAATSTSSPSQPKTAISLPSKSINKDPAIEASTSTSLDKKADNLTVEQAQAVTAWEFSGAIAARDTKKSWTAQVNWSQQGPASYQIRLFGPLGSGTVLIERQGGLVTYRDGPKRVQSKSADELLLKQTGIRLPVHNLYYWLRALPAPGKITSEKRLNAKQLLVLQQAGFTIEYLEYSQIGKTVLPKIIKLQGNGIYVKLVIKRWKAY